MAKYRVGIVGCGGIARVHAQAYQQDKNTELVCCSDINANAADKFGGEFEIPESSCYLDHRLMLEKEKPDIISVCTWHGSHASVTIDACNMGVKGVISEKPIATRLGDADAAIEAAEKNGTKYVIGHQGRFSSANTKARELVKAGAIGQPTALFRNSGDGLLNNGTHAIDYARYILGDPEVDWVIGQVSRHTDKWERRVRIEDLCMGLVCFKGGTRFVIESDLPGPQPPSSDLYGTEGTIRIVNDKVFIMNGDQAGWREVKSDEPVAKVEAVMQEGWSAPAGISPGQLSELIAWIEGNIAEHRGAARHARADLEIMMAIYESLRIHDVVHLPLQTKESPLELMIDGGALPVTKSGKYDIRVPF
jgi:UDP-N-acetyl-2-amino-2-deoxyglucuronate dehydrogenase